jgi:hypothetical protein
MRRLAAALAFVGFSFGIAALPATASASAAKTLDREISGPVTGTSTFDLTTPTCPAAAHQVFDATYTIKKGGTGSFNLDGCTALASPVNTLPFSGTFTLTVPDGATMSGTAAGPINPITGAFSISLTPTGGTSEFANVGGAVNFSGTWNSNMTQGVPSPISGSLAGALKR